MGMQVKFRRGTTAQHSTFTGAEGEVTVDTSKKTAVVHDGTTAGGHALATQAGVTTDIAAGVAEAKGYTDTSLSPVTTQLDAIVQDMTELQNTGVDTVARAQLDASLSGFKPSHSIWDEFEERGVNAAWFGVVADANYYDDVNNMYYSDLEMTVPATDNKSALQNAVDYLSSIGGGTLFVPQGTICLHSGVKWKTKVSMVGAGIGSTKFVTQGVSFSLFYQTDNASDGTDAEQAGVWLEDCMFENFECDLRGLSFQGEDVGGKAFFMLYMRRARFNNLLLRDTIGTALGCDFLTESVISNVVVYNAGRNWQASGFPIYSLGQSGIGIGTGALEDESVVVSNCHVYNCGNFGIFVEGQGSTIKSKYAKIIGCHTDGNRVGIANRSSGPISVISCSSVNSVEDGVFLNGSVGDTIQSSIISGNGGDGIDLDTTQLGNCLLNNNRIFSNGEMGIRIRGADAYGNTKENVSIVGNHIYKNGHSGILFDAGHTHIDIKDNIIYDNGQTGTSQWTNVGIYAGGAHGVNIVGNTLYDDQASRTQVTDMTLQNTVTDYYVSGNTLETKIIGAGAISNGIFGNNAGLVTVKRGQSTFENGSTVAYITHYFQDDLKTTVKSVSLVPIGNQHLWISAIESNRLKVSRESGDESLVFYWEVNAV